MYGRLKSNGRIQRGELELLYYFDVEVRVDWTSLSINRFLYQAKRTTGALVIGGFITRIAERLGVFDRHMTSLKIADGWPSELNADYLMGMHMLQRRKRAYVLVKHKRDALNATEEVNEEIAQKPTLEDQVANLQRSQEELQRSQEQLLKNQESMGKQLAEMLALMQQQVQHPTP